MYIARELFLNVFLPLKGCYDIYGLHLHGTWFKKDRTRWNPQLRGNKRWYNLRCHN